MKDKLQEIYALERLSGGDTLIHRLHPTAKLLATLIYIITVISFDRYAAARLMPCAFFPLLLMALAEIPYALLLKRVMLALPFCLLAGVGNIFYDRAAAFTLGGVTVSFGVISFAAIIIRVLLCVMAILILVAVTPLPRLTAALVSLRLPPVFVIIFEMTYRYIGVLLAEARGMYLAYSLRGADGKGIALPHMGSFIGQLLLRGFDRAERVYQAMKCRGYNGADFARVGGGWQRRDLLFLAATVFFCALCRYADINALLFAAAGGGS